MGILDEYFYGLIRVLYENDVEYILVGGVATNLHGNSRLTADVNIWLKDNLENRKKLRKALSDLSLGDIPAIETTQFIPGRSSIKLESGLEPDIMTELAGLEKYSFEECYKISPIAEIQGVEVKFLHINLLIENKKKVNRDKDKLDVAELERIKKETGI
jgi:hypothetical protein